MKATTRRTFPRRRMRECVTCGKEQVYIRATTERPGHFGEARWTNRAGERLWSFTRLPEALKRAGMALEDFGMRFGVTAKWEHLRSRSAGPRDGIWFSLPGEGENGPDRTTDPRVRRIVRWIAATIGAAPRYGFHDSVNGHTAPLHRCRFREVEPAVIAPGAPVERFPCEECEGVIATA